MAEIINRTMVKKEIIYPIFTECMPHAADKFWETVFEDLAYGKTPHGVYISKESLICGYKKKDFCYKIDQTQDPKLVHDDVYKLLNERLGLLSTSERAAKMAEFHRIAESLQEKNMEWSKIKKKNTKDQLIEIFVASMKDEHSLSLKRARQLLAVIFIAMMFKVISAKDINYSDGKIHSIEGITFAKGDFSMDKNIYSGVVDFAPEAIPEKPLMSDAWGEYLKIIGKKL